MLQLAIELARRGDQCDVHAFCNKTGIAQELQEAGCRAHYVAGDNRVVWDYVSFPLAARRHSLDYIIYPNNIIPLSHLLMGRAKRLNVIHDLAYFSRDLHEYKLLDT